MKKQELKKIPHFNNEDEEAAFWLEHEFTDYYDSSRWVKAEFPDLKPSDPALISPDHRQSFDDRLDTLIEKHRTTLEGLAER